jgi:MYXO-CTERM domain-containing protein
MKWISCLTLLCALPAFAQTSAQTSTSPVLPSIANAPAGVVARAVRDTMLDARWLAADPTFAGADDVVVRGQRVGEQIVVRAQPRVSGIAVEGADRVVVVDSDGVSRIGSQARSLVPKQAFSLQAHDAVWSASAVVRGSMLTDVSVERVDGLAQQVWLSTSSGLRPAWRVRLPTWQLENLRDVWVDGSTGAVIKSEQVAHFGSVCGDGRCVAGEEDADSCPADCVAAEGEGEGEPIGPVPTAARAFDGAPPGDANTPAQLAAALVDIDLGDLLPGRVGDPLRGYHFETANCCKYVVCNDGGDSCLQNIPEGQLAVDVATCASQDDIDAGIAVESVIQPENGIPRDSLPIPANLINFVPDPVFVKISFCAEIPRARSTNAGWVFSPVDGDRSSPNKCGTEGADPIGCAAEEDAFAEVQVYAATQVFFEHIRTVLNDDGFCLGGQSQQCDDDGNAILDSAGQPVRPFHIATNVLFPAFDLTALGQQLIGGKGATAGNPVVIDDFQRLPNAAFIPALEGGPVQIPSELSALASLFSRPFDSNVYFQGSRDFAYDGDVVRHEFTHAIVHSFVPGLASLGRDSQGAHAESGALNEGWADYFSSSFAGNPTVGDYAGQGLNGVEIGLRNNDNDRRCPDGIIGQVHNDSEHWAGALWAIRTEHVSNGGNVNALDRALLLALSQADNDEDMTRAAARVVTALEPLSAELATFATAEFADRGVSDCVRVWPLSTVNAAGDDIDVTPKDTLFQLGLSDVGVANFAPSVLQFRVEVPAGSAGFDLSWVQVASGGEAPMSVVVTEVTDAEADARIDWRYEGANDNEAAPYTSAGEGIVFDPTASAALLGTADANGAQAATFTHTLTPSCTKRSFVLALTALDGGATLSNISVASIAGDNTCAAEGEGEGEGEDIVDEGCDCSTGRPSSLIPVALVLLALRRRRRR